MTFQDRQDAGRQLAQRLMVYQHDKPFIIGLPRGGVIVAYEVAQALKAPLDVIAVRKLTAPDQPELGLGAIAPNGIRILDTRMIRILGLSASQLEKITEAEVGELERRQQRYRGDRPAPDIRGRTVMLVDDGLATGVSAKAAIRALRQLRPKKLLFAVPVGAPDALNALRPEVDELICLESPMEFMAIGLHYRCFERATDEDVVTLLEKSSHRVEISP